MRLINGRILTPQGDMRWLTIENGVITAIGAGDPPTDPDPDVIDAGGQTVIPGFIDIHIHGSAGFDVMDATPDALRGMAKFLAQHGVTGFLATTLTHPQADLMRALENIRACMDAPDWEGARLLGARLEGPYLNVEKAGAQNPEHIRTADPDEANALLNTGIVRVLDIAPEIDANIWLIHECVGRGITVSIAHTSATADQALWAHERGITLSTHTYNAQTPLHHREPGVVGAVLAIDAIRCELIADGVHVHPLALIIAWRCKGPDGLLLISDAVRAAGMPDGNYQFDARTVVLADGAVRLENGTLAGSSLTLDRALRTMEQITDEPIDVLWPITSRTAAAAIHMSDRIGTIAVGMDGDLVILDETLTVQRTIVRGKTVYTVEPMKAAPNAVTPPPAEIAPVAVVPAPAQPEAESAATPTPSGTVEPDAAQPTQPTAAQPEAVQPDAAQPTAAQPAPIEPEPVQPTQPTADSSPVI